MISDVLLAYFIVVAAVILWTVFSTVFHLVWQEKTGREGVTWWCAMCFPTWAWHKLIETSLNRLVNKLGVQRMNRIIADSAEGKAVYMALRLCCPKCGHWFERVRMPWANLDGLPIGNWPCPECRALVLDVNTMPPVGGGEEVIVKI